MLKKKNIMCLITSVIAVLYILCCIIPFVNIRAALINAFSDTMMDVSDSISDYIISEYEEEKSGEIFYNINPEELIAENSFNDKFPYIIYVCNEKNEIIACTENCISFYEPVFITKQRVIRCFLDEYLTPQTRKQLTDFQNSNETYSGLTFKYVEDDEKIIPVTLIINYENKGEKEIKFTDNVPTDQVQFPTFDISFFLADINDKDYRHGDYEDIRNFFKNEMQGKYSGESADFMFDMENGQFEQILLSGDEGYNVYLFGKMTPSVYVFHDNAFKVQIAAISFVFLALLIVILVLTDYMFKNNQMKSAKYSFANAAAHELKTPLAVIQNQCECILEGINAENSMQYVQSIYEESVRMTQLVQKLLQYNSLVSGMKLVKNACDLGIITSNETDKYRAYLSDKNLNIKIISDSNCIVKCNGELIALVIDNFLSNAVKFADKDSEIVVVLKKNNDKCQLSVFNKGKPISAENKKNIWTLLYKEDESRKADGVSGGMGLAVSKQILELHNYKYGYINSTNGVEFYFIAQ